eukprot:13126482-Heterocapsa_arctica.AAC.1
MKGTPHQKNKGINTLPLFDTSADINIGDITMLELNNIIRNFKNNKAPGPSGVPIEAVKPLDET